MSSLVLQAEYKNGRTLWHEVWSGGDGANAVYWATHYARLNESPVILLEMRNSGDGAAIPTATRKFNRQGVGRPIDEPWEEWE